MSTDGSPPPAHAVPELPPSRLGALAYRDFRFLWTSGLFQGVGSNMREMLTFLLVYQISGSVLQTGLTGAFQAGPSIVFGLIGGALADTVDRKKLLIYTQSAIVVSGALLTFLVFADVIAVWHLWLFTTFWSSVHILSRPAQRAYVPRLVPQSKVLNAITWHSSLSQGTLFVGPLLAGFLADYTSIALAYAVNTGIQATALLVILGIRAPGRPEGGSHRTTPGSMARTIWEGVRFVRMHEVLKAAMVMDYGVMAVGFLRPLLPALALDVYGVGEAGLGVMGGATAVGSVLGTVTLLTVREIKRKGIVIVGAYLLYAGAMALLGLSPWFLLALVALAITGYMDAVAFTVKQALIQIVAPDHYRGRAASLSSILSVSGNATGAVEMGTLASFAGAPGALVINSAIAAGMTVIVTLRWMGLWRSEA